MIEEEKPYYDEEVLKYLHFELMMSSGEIGDLFDVARQTIQKVVRNMDFEFHQRRSKSKVVPKDQAILSDYEQSGIGDFV
jgi:predicted DNA-binding protein YlxM (UPF0122 family)